MAVTKTSIALDSAAELRNLVGDDATAAFEGDPKFIDSNPTARASSEHVALRDTDDLEDSEEEDEDEDLDDEDKDDDDEEEEDFDEDDNTEEFGASVMRAA